MSCIFKILEISPSQNLPHSPHHLIHTENVFYPTCKISPFLCSGYIAAQHRSYKGQTCLCISLSTPHFLTIAYNWVNFYHGPLIKRGRDQGMAILLLLLLLLLLLQSSIGPIRAKQIFRCYSLIG